MAAKDIYHNAVVQALINDGWTITHDPLTVAVEETNLLIDFGAERVVTAEREGQRIAVEVKSFVSLSAVQDLKEAAGQYLLYQLALAQSRSDQDRQLYLAIRESVYQSVFVNGVGKLFLSSNTLCLLVFDPNQEKIVRWIP